MNSIEFDHLRNVFMCLYGEKANLENFPEEVRTQLKYTLYREEEGGLEILVRHVIGHEMTDMLVNGIYKLVVPNYEERVYPDDREVDITWFSQGAPVLNYLGLLVKAVVLPEEYDSCLEKSYQFVNTNNINLCLIVYLYLTGEEYGGFVWIP